MKRLTFSFSILILTFIWIYHTAATDYNPAINSVIGDISYVKKFGHLPAPGTDENLRIKTHLAYAEMLLRSKETTTLDSATLLKRETLLDHLHSYWVAGIFPKNYDRKNQRSPCFIDKEGNICAVGYLVEKSAGIQLAESINKEFKYSKISDMRSPALAEWIKDHGLTKEEAGMIQPSYNWKPEPGETPAGNDRMAGSYIVSSSLLGGINLAAGGLQVFNKSPNRLILKLGIATGAAQTVLGLASYPGKKRNINGEVGPNEHKKVLSRVNIGLGASTLLLSSWNLIAEKPVKETLYTWDVHSVPLNEKETAVAFSVKRKF